MTVTASATSILCCCFLLLLWRTGLTDAFSIHDAPFSASTSAAGTALFSNAPRQPRRMLKKRRRRAGSKPRSQNEDFPWDTAESRALVPSVSKETGEDYWIDEKELERERNRRTKQQRTKLDDASKEKLMTEVKAPYQQNWIGYFSMVIVILSVIVVKFPELLNAPVIQIPDL